MSQLNKRLTFWTAFGDSPCEIDLILAIQVRAIIYCLLMVHTSVWELHTSGGTPPYLLFSVESTTNLVGHIIFTSFVDRRKNIKM